MELSRNIEQSARARLFGALADPARIAILDQLQGGSRCVCELEGIAGGSSSLLAYHLKILREAGLVTSTREGRKTRYETLPEGLASLQRASSYWSSGIGSRQAIRV
jgi:ArsR family transcriptional regulator